MGDCRRSCGDVAARRARTPGTNTPPRPVPPPAHTRSHTQIPRTLHPPAHICEARSNSVSSGSSRCTRLPVLSASCRQQAGGDRGWQSRENREAGRQARPPPPACKKHPPAHLPTRHPWPHRTPAWLLLAPAGCWSRCKGRTNPCSLRRRAAVAASKRRWALRRGGQPRRSPIKQGHTDQLMHLLRPCAASAAAHKHHTIQPMTGGGKRRRRAAAAHCRCWTPLGIRPPSASGRPPAPPRWPGRRR